MSFPSRTCATMPHPQEQKLHEVVNSWIWESFRSFAAALTSAAFRTPSRARPAPPQRVSLSRSRRLTEGARPPDEAVLSERWSEGLSIGSTPLSLIAYGAATDNGT